MGSSLSRPSWLAAHALWCDAQGAQMKWNGIKNKHFLAFCHVHKIVCWLPSILSVTPESLFLFFPPVPLPTREEQRKIEGQFSAHSNKGITFISLEAVFLLCPEFLSTHRLQITARERRRRGTLRLTCIFFIARPTALKMMHKLKVVPILLQESAKLNGNKICLQNS